MRQRKHWFLVIALAVLAGFLAVGYGGVRNALAVPLERTTVIRVSALPNGSKPVRIALLSDIHVGNFIMQPERLRGIVNAVNDTRPDIVLLAGDFVIGESSEGTATRVRDLAPLAGLRAPGGIFAVLGNHDYWTDPESIRAALRRAGVQVLENDAVRRGPITIIGIGDRFSGHDKIALSSQRAAALGGIPIAFTHSPDLAPTLSDDMPILFAGHTHCGQMVASLIGPIVRYSHWRRLYDPKYRCGRIDEQNRVTIVTAGIGSGELPLRFNAPPDWWLIELRPLTERDVNKRTGN